MCILYGVGPGANDRVMAFTTAYNAITKGKRKEAREGRTRGGGLLQSAATAAYKSYAPASSARQSDRHSVVGPYGFPFRGETSTFFLLFLPCAVCRLSLFAVEEEGEEED